MPPGGYIRGMNAAGTDATPWTVARLLTWTRSHLEQHGIESPRLCAELLLAHAMQCQRIHLYTRFEDVPSADVRDRFRDLVRHAAAGHPIAYLTGTKEFFALPFEVTPDVLIPRPETEILVERTVDLARKSGGRLCEILDLGTGSGCIAVSLARHLPESRVLASDISENALAVARRNAKRLGVGERIEFRCGDLFAPWSDSKSTSPAAAAMTFDIVVSNPPYVATEGAPVEASVRKYEPAAALFAGPDGLAVIRPLVEGAAAHVRPGGHLLLEVAFDQAPAVRALLANGPWGDIVTYRDGGGHERVVHARRAV